jgi:hypothetical protein
MTHLHASNAVAGACVAHAPVTARRRAYMFG